MQAELPVESAPSSAELERQEKVRRRYRRLVFFTWFLCFDLIMFGAFVRLTGSGLGCPDWPGCYGSVTPIGALEEIRAAEAYQPYGPVTLPKAWIEMLHRYVAVLLGLLIIGIMVMAIRHRQLLKQSPALAIAIFFAVCFQGALGAWTVTLLLKPAIVTSHLLGGISLLALLTWLAARQKAHVAVAQRLRKWWPAAVAALVLLYSQIALGGWVSTNYAALACLDFPKCQGQWIPEMNFEQGFQIVRKLGETSDGERLEQPALVAIHWVHRNFALVVLAFVGWLAWKLRREPGLSAPAYGMLFVLVLQTVTGLTNIFLKWPLAVAVVHTGGAAALIMLMIMIMLRLYGAGRETELGHALSPSPQTSSLSGVPRQ